MKIVKIKGYFTTTVTVAAKLGSPEAWIAQVLIDFDFLDIDLLSIDHLLGRLEQFVDNIFGVKRYKAVAPALIFRLVEGGLDLDNGTVLSKVGLDVLVRDVRSESSDEDLAVLGLLAHSLWIYL